MRGVLFLLGPEGARAVSLLPADCRRRMHASLEAYARRFITACRAGLPAGSVPSVVRGAIAPAVAARVALPSWRPAARLLETLPPALVPLFRDETGGLLLPDPKPAVLAAALRPKRAFGNEAQLEALYARVLAAGLARGPAPQERVRGRVGLFCVGKDADSDRLILDCNELFALPPALRVHLPTPADLASVELPPASVGQVFVSKIDLSSFYFSVLLESWLHPFFALPRLSPAAMARLGVSDVFWCAGVMGWAPMVGSTQAAHLHLKAEVEAACLHLPTAEQHRLVDLTAAPQQTAVGTYIDDSLRLSLRRGVLETLLARTRVAYARAGWREAAAKTVAPTTDPTSLIGVLFSPRSRRLAPEPERLVALLRDTAAFLVTPLVSGEQLSALLGRWVWLLLLFRPLLSVLVAAYRFVAVAGPEPLYLWPSVRVELQALLDLAPFLSVDLARPWAPLVTASDASEFGCGVAYSRPPREVAREWACQLGSFAPASAAVHGRAVPSPVVAAVAAAPWSVAVSAPWRWRSSIIAALEGEAFAVRAHWLARMPSAVGCRVLNLLDSMSFGGAAAKGRSSAPCFRRQLRAGAGWALLGDFRSVDRWIPTASMPADAASRLFRVDHSYVGRVDVGAKGGEGTKGDDRGPWVSLRSPAVPLVVSALRAATQRRYAAALRGFEAFVRACSVGWSASVAGAFWVESVDRLDSLFAAFVAHLQREHAPLSQADKVFWALRRFNPWLPRYALPTAFACVAAIAKLAIPKRKSASPLSMSLLRFVVVGAARMPGARAMWTPICAVASFLAFDCLLRSAEVLRLTVENVVFPRDGGLPTLVLRDPKTGGGLSQFVRVRRRWVATLLRVVIGVRPLADPLFPLSVGVWRLWWREAVLFGRLPGRFTLHSFRHSGATELWLARAPPATIMVVGRWASDKSFRVYVRQWLLALLQLDVLAPQATFGRQCRRPLFRWLVWQLAFGR